MLYPATKRLECQRGYAIEPLTGNVLRIGCDRWECRDCGPRKRDAMVLRATRLPRSYRTLKFITITAPAAPLCCYDGAPVPEVSRVFPDGSPQPRCDGHCALCVRVFNHLWRALYQWLKRTFGAGFKCIWSNEVGEHSGHLHKHILANVDYIPQRELSEACQRFALGRVCDVRAVKSVHEAARYLTAYLTKAAAGTWPRMARRFQSSPGLTAPKVRSAERWIVEITRKRIERVSPYRHAVDEAIAMDKRQWDNDQIEREAEAEPRQGSLFAPAPGLHFTRWVERKSASTDAIRGQELVL